VALRVAVPPFQRVLLSLAERFSARVAAAAVDACTFTYIHMERDIYGIHRDT
jgi:hypothetical protein